MFNPHLLLSIPLLLTLWLLPFSSLAQAPPTVDFEERERGIQLYRAKDYTKSAKILKIAVKKNDADDQAWYYLGLALTQQPKELKNATKAFETAIKLKPNFAAAHTGLGYVLLRRNKFSEALHEAQTAIGLEPKLANAHYVVGVVRLSASAFADALAAANEAIRLNPKLAAAYLLKSESLWGIYVGPIENPPLAALRRKNPAPVPAPSPTEEQLEERRRKRKQNEVILGQSAESLETYLKLNPADPSAALWREQLATLKVLSNVGQVDGELVRHGDEVTSKARVLAKPEPRYTEEARRAQIIGTVVLRAIFFADGTIRHILVIRGLPFGLTERAIAAARAIRFTPAMKDGRPVSMFVQLEYNFNLY